MNQAEAFVKSLDPEMHQTVMKLAGRLQEDLSENLNYAPDDGIQQLIIDEGMKAAARIIIERIQKSLGLDLEE